MPEIVKQDQRPLRKIKDKRKKMKVFRSAYFCLENKELLDPDEKWKIAEGEKKQNNAVVRYAKLRNFTCALTY